ncbi:hypothetical protein E1200_01185 [Actinomadura sp. GC306]|uniref:hypothetical protein n=1 Tax=Actinomadura sp. GC306 TaxID=2530367 RepID=UPI00104527D1|nr:hypothetical protein [Actinomadura sp. GC306]TDC71682.1 hypothetical protein E1200_01185 [Actinomadura sp. GC306]
MVTGVSKQADETTGHALRYLSSLPAGFGIVLEKLLAGETIALALAALDARVPAFALGAAMAVVSGVVISSLTRSVTLTRDGRLRVTGLGRSLDIRAHQITAVTVPRRARLGFGSAMIHWDGGKSSIWRPVRYTPVQRSKWSLRYKSGHGGKDFGDLVYRLRFHNPAILIEGVQPPPWALPQPPRRY